MEKTEKEYIAFFHIPKQTERRVRKSESQGITFNFYFSFGFRIGQFADITDA